MNKSKTSYKDNIEKETIDNDNFRKVVFTGTKMQLVLMVLKPSEDIGEEIHDGHDQFFRFEEGIGKVIIDDEVHEVEDGDAVVVPSGANHNVINTSDTQDLKLYTIYTPPEHPPKTVFKTKAESLE